MAMAGVRPPPHTTSLTAPRGRIIFEDYFSSFRLASEMNLPLGAHLSPLPSAISACISSVFYPCWRGSPALSGIPTESFVALAPKFRSLGSRATRLCRFSASSRRVRAACGLPY